MAKLVRDKIPEIIKSKGVEAEVYIADDSEYSQRLNEKLVEEVEEYVKGGEVEELADVLEVIDAIKEFKKINGEELMRIKEKKREERGGFGGKIILD